MLFSMAGTPGYLLVEGRDLTDGSVDWDFIR